MNIAHVASELVLAIEAFTFAIVGAAERGTLKFWRFDAMPALCVALEIGELGYVDLTSRFWTNISIVDFDMFLLMYREGFAVTGCEETSRKVTSLI